MRASGWRIAPGQPYEQAVSNFLLSATVLPCFSSAVELRGFLLSLVPGRGLDVPVPFCFGC